MKRDVAHPSHRIFTRFDRVSRYLYYITLPFKSHNIMEGLVPRNNNQTSTAVTILLLFNPERFEYIHQRKILYYI